MLKSSKIILPASKKYRDNELNEVSVGKAGVPTAMDIAGSGVQSAQHFL
jgi:hypothetical protein